MFKTHKSNHADVYLSVGSNNSTDNFVKKALEAGADGFRLIAKGATPEDILSTYLRTCALVGDQTKVILDLPGKKPRLTSDMPEQLIKSGDEVIFSLKGGSSSSTSLRVGIINLAEYIKFIKPGHRLIIKVGDINFGVTRCTEWAITATYIGTRRVRLAPNRSVNFPDSKITYKPLSDSDKALLRILPVSEEVVLAVSMVSSSKDIEAVRSFNSKAQIIPKIETKLAALKNIDEIVKASSTKYGFMFARGDTSIELSVSEVIQATKLVIEKSKKYDRKFMLATWILYSLKFRDFPSPDSLADILYFYEKGCRDYIISGDPAPQKPVESVMWLRSILNTIDS